MKIYVVWGVTGEYSDQQSWLVCAYRDRVLAERHSDRAAQRAHQIFHTVGYHTDAKNLWDPEMRMDYAGTDYCVLEVDLREELPDDE